MNNSPQNKRVGAAMVIGGGIGGMQASLDLAAAGIKVYIVEKKPCIGGVMAQLDKTFPTNDCAMCTMAPRLVEIARHKDIKIITMAGIENIKGEAGNWTVSLTKERRFVEEEKCNGCGSCVLACPLGKLKPSKDDDKKPKPIPDEFNLGLSFRPAIYIPYAQAIPNIAVVDSQRCLFLTTGKCGMPCKKACKVEAINFEQKVETIELNVGAIILAPGYELFDANLKPDYGYGKFPNVITSLMFERILSASGPFQGKVLRPSDKKEPKRIAFIQCVGSRDSDRDYCSSVCCMYATKEAIMAKEHIGKELQCDVFFMDVRAFGKGFEEYYNRAKELGVNYIRCRIPSILQLPDTNNLVIQYLSDDNRKLTSEYDLVVLSVGIQPVKGFNEPTNKFGLNLNKFGFCETTVFEPVESKKEGIYPAGVFTGPKDIPETVMQATAAASKAMVLLSSAKGSLITPKEYPPEIDVRGQDPRIGVFVCHCGTNIASVVDVPQVVESAKTLPGVVFTTNTLYVCSTDACELIKNKIKEHNLNRVIVASCTPRTHEPLFQSVIREAGLNEYLFEMANIRDQCSWVHMNNHKEATKKAKDLVRMAIAKVRSVEPLYRGRMKINREAVVIGGGVAGMTTALDLANQDFVVHLIEKEKELGGNLKKTKYLLNGENVQQKLSSITESVVKHKNIRIYTTAQIINVEGSVGRFKTLIKTDQRELTIEHGVIIVATGAQEYKPTEYLYGQDERIMTQLEFEDRLSTHRLPLTNNRSPLTVVMIQCVGSRQEDRPYCSRTCCSEAIKNALKIKEISPDSNVYILYRDIRSYGFLESYYTKAREKGVAFIRYADDKKPEVTKENDQIKVKLFSPTLDANVLIDADFVVLSAATIPNDGNEDLAKKLKVPLTKDKFFLEAHMKLRPVDFATEGIFLCGAAHSPKSLDETISQASAAASRASTIISKDEIELEAAISNPVDENCDGCAYCVDPCPYKAITLIEYMRDGSVKKTIEVDESLCKGCGVCQATCPKKGVYIRHFKLDYLSAMVEAALGVPSG